MPCGFGHLLIGCWEAGREVAHEEVGESALSPVLSERGSAGTLRRPSGEDRERDLASHSPGKGHRFA